MDSRKYIGMDVHKENHFDCGEEMAQEKIVIECMIETKASMIPQFIDGLRGDLLVRLKKEPRPPGCMTCGSHTSRTWWCAIRAGGSPASLRARMIGPSELPWDSALRSPRSLC